MCKILLAMTILFSAHNFALVDYIEYDANEFPDEASPAWTRTGNIGKSEIIVDPEHPSNKLLNLVSPAGEKLAFKINWDAKDDKGATVVIRFKLNAGAAFIAMDNGTVWESFEITPDEAYSFFSDIHPGADPAKWHTYRLTLEKGVFSIYVDEKPLDPDSKPVASGDGLPKSGSGVPPNAIQIGQSTTLGGGVQILDELDLLIDYVYFDPDGISLLPEVSYSVSAKEKLAASWAEIKSKAAKGEFWGRESL